MSKKQRFFGLLTGATVIGFVIISQNAIIEWPPMIGDAFTLFTSLL
ncbi:MAG: hypothetical protein SPJ62_06295 [Inconstantimicrobium porci]|nr:hypothetical protein [Inconstantimicrobium porci]MDY5911609.1 hypothetical protein [Inconstantimicrobium porci]